MDFGHVHKAAHNAQEVIIITDTQSFSYQLTFNNPSEKGWSHEHILEVMRNNFKTLVYICMADEQGSCFHTHVFVVFASRVRFSMVKRYFNEAHIEKCKGSVSDNVNYVKKLENGHPMNPNRKRKLTEHLKNMELNHPIVKVSEPICPNSTRW